MRTAAVMLILVACSRPEAGPETGPERGSERGSAAGAATAPGSSTAPGPATAPGSAELPHRVLPTAEVALRSILQPAGGEAPRVIGIGEHHQTRRTEAVRSALSRFTGELLPVLSGRVSDLVIESWTEPAGCDGEAAQASAEVSRDIDRPPATENELVTLIERARALRIRSHLLAFSCADYRALRAADNQVDYEALLGAVTTRLRERALAGLAHEGAVIALYGGALHNDLHPNPGVADFSYAVAVDGAAPGRYLEIDLLVPEYVTGNRALAGEPWYPLLDRAGPDQVILYERGPRSYVLILPRSTP